MRAHGALTVRRIDRWAPFGKYRLVALLGRGGMGEVWRAFDAETDRTVAPKVLPAHLADDETFQKRFRRAARGGGFV
jgi:serine/threonine protein kinase